MSEISNRSAVILACRARGSEFHALLCTEKFQVTGDLCFICCLLSAAQYVHKDGTDEALRQLACVCAVVKRSKRMGSCLCRVKLASEKMYVDGRYHDISFPGCGTTGTFL